MGTGVLIYGKSGTGKSTSMRNFKKGELGIINVISKPLPFQTDIEPFNSDNYDDIKSLLDRSKATSVVIDDSGYLMTNQFMKSHTNIGAGNATYNFYNEIGDNFWKLVQHIKDLPKNKIVYVVMHEDKNEFGDVKPKTLGKLIDDKVDLAGMFTIVLRTKKIDTNYYFFTQSTEGDSAKSPMNMFKNLYIDNDLKEVDNIIREFYHLDKKEE